MIFRIEINLKIYYIVLIVLYGYNYYKFMKEINKISGLNFGDFDFKFE